MKIDRSNIEVSPDFTKALELASTKGFKRPNRIIMLYWLSVGTLFGSVGLYHVVLDQTGLAAVCTVCAAIALAGMRHHVMDKPRHVVVKLHAQQRRLSDAER